VVESSVKSWEGQKQSVQTSWKKQGQDNHGGFIDFYAGHQMENGFAECFCYRSVLSLASTVLQLHY
jgi:hypothetical protein